MESLGPFLGAYGYPAVFGWTVIQQVVAVVPGEPFLLGVGTLAGSSRFSLWLAAAFALAGTVTGDLIWYEIGSRGGHRVLKYLGRFLDRAGHVHSAHGRSGVSALLIGKIVPGLNGMGPPLAGAIGMSRLRFLILDLFGATLWVGLYLGLGYAFHDQLAEAAVLASHLAAWRLAIVGATFALYLSVTVIRRQFVVSTLRVAPIRSEE